MKIEKMRWRSCIALSIDEFRNQEYRDPLPSLVIPQKFICSRDLWKIAHQSKMWLQCSENPIEEGKEVDFDSVRNIYDLCGVRAQNAIVSVTLLF